MLLSPADSPSSATIAATPTAIPAAVRAVRARRRRTFATISPSTDQILAQPGDGAAVRPQTTSSPTTPSVSRVIPAAPATPVNTEECNLFWQHLRLAGFVAGATQGAAGGQQPNNAVNGIMGVQTGVGAATLGFASNIICTTNLPDKIAIAVDTQMDDGTMQTGQVRSSGAQAAPNPALAALPGGTTNYVENGTNQYTLCKNL